MITAEEYLKLFEQNIIVAGVEKKLVPTNSVMVPVKDGKLDITPFGTFLGNRFESELVLVIDYYGLLKKSDGFIKKYNSYTDVEIKRLKANTVYFASIKIEDIVNLDKGLAVDFPGFKKYLVTLRGFSKK
jgi:hypothetical protein